MSEKSIEERVIQAAQAYREQVESFGEDTDLGLAEYDYGRGFLAGARAGAEKERERILKALDTLPAATLRRDQKVQGAVDMWEVKRIVKGES